MAESSNELVTRVWYRERMQVPPEARVHVSLQDVARMDVAATVIAENAVAAVNGPPWNISLAYDPAALEDRGRYAVRAWIDLEGKLLFTTDTHIPAFDGDEPVEIMMVRVGASGAGAAAGSALPGQPVGAGCRWRPIGGSG